ncbi:hypothetical protein L9F63_024613, partial [Diploptera punctata]
MENLVELFKAPHLSSIVDSEGVAYSIEEAGRKEKVRKINRLRLRDGVVSKLEDSCT